MVELEIAGMRLNEQQTSIVKEYVNKLDDQLYSHIFICKLPLGQVEVYLYRHGSERYSYDAFKKFDSKDFMLGYMQALNDYIKGTIFTL